jgi:hypothetical protein
VIVFGRLLMDVGFLNDAGSSFGIALRRQHQNPALIFSGGFFYTRASGFGAFCPFDLSAVHGRLA